MKIRLTTIALLIFLLSTPLTGAAMPAFTSYPTSDTAGIINQFYPYVLGTGNVSSREQLQNIMLAGILQKIIAGTSRSGETRNGETGDGQTSSGQTYTAMDVSGRTQTVRVSGGALTTTNSENAGIWSTIKEARNAVIINGVKRELFVVQFSAEPNYPLDGKPIVGQLSLPYYTKELAYTAYFNGRQVPINQPFPIEEKAVYGTYLSDGETGHRWLVKGEGIINNQRVVFFIRAAVNMRVGKAGAFGTGKDGTNTATYEEADNKVQNKDLQEGGDGQQGQSGKGVKPGQGASAANGQLKAGANGEIAVTGTIKEMKIAGSKTEIALSLADGTTVMVHAPASNRLPEDMKTGSAITAKGTLHQDGQNQYIKASVLTGAGQKTSAARPNETEAMRKLREQAEKSQAALVAGAGGGGLTPEKPANWGKVVGGGGGGGTGTGTGVQSIEELLKNTNKTACESYPTGTQWFFRMIDSCISVGSTGVNADASAKTITKKDKTREDAASIQDRQRVGYDVSDKLWASIASGFGAGIAIAMRVPGGPAAKAIALVLSIIVSLGVALWQNWDDLRYAGIYALTAQPLMDKWSDYLMDAAIAGVTTYLVMASLTTLGAWVQGSSAMVAGAGAAGKVLGGSMSIFGRALSWLGGGGAAKGTSYGEELFLRMLPSKYGDAVRDAYASANGRAMVNAIVRMYRDSGKPALHRTKDAAKNLLRDADSAVASLEGLATNFLKNEATQAAGVAGRKVVDFLRLRQDSSLLQRLNPFRNDGMPSNLELGRLYRTIGENYKGKGLESLNAERLIRELVNPNPMAKTADVIKDVYRRMPVPERLGENISGLVQAAERAGAGSTTEIQNLRLVADAMRNPENMAGLSRESLEAAHRTARTLSQDLSRQIESLSQTSQALRQEVNQGLGSVVSDRELAGAARKLATDPAAASKNIRDMADIIAQGGDKISSSNADYLRQVAERISSGEVVSPQARGSLQSVQQSLETNFSIPAGELANIKSRVASVTGLDANAPIQRLIDAGSRSYSTALGAGDRMLINDLNLLHQHNTAQNAATSIKEAILKSDIAQLQATEQSLKNAVSAAEQAGKAADSLGKYIAGQEAATVSNYELGKELARSVGQHIEQSGSGAPTATGLYAQHPAAGNNALGTAYNIVADTVPSSGDQLKDYFAKKPR